MLITQTIDIPAEGRRTFEVPREVPAGRTIVSFTPAKAYKSPEEIAARDREIFEKYADELNAEAEDVLSYQNMYLDEIEK